MAANDNNNKLVSRVRELNSMKTDNSKTKQYNTKESKKKPPCYNIVERCIERLGFILGCQWNRNGEPMKMLAGNFIEHK